MGLTTLECGGVASLAVGTLFLILLAGGCLVGLAALPAGVLLLLALLDAMSILLASVALEEWASGLVFLTSVLQVVVRETVVEEVLLLFCAGTFHLYFPDVHVQFG